MQLKFSDSKSHNALISTPGIDKKRCTAASPREPIPINPTRTVEIGSQRSFNTSDCPAGRGGVFTLITFCRALQSNETNNKKENK